MQDFKIMLHNLTIIRNICAHDEKLYDIRLKNRISSNRYHLKMKIKKNNGNYLYATRDLFSIIIILKLLLNKDDFISFYKQVIIEVLKLERRIKSIDFKLVLNNMGFPNNYIELFKL